MPCIHPNWPPTEYFQLFFFLLQLCTAGLSGVCCLLETQSETLHPDFIDFFIPDHYRIYFTPTWALKYMLAHFKFTLYKHAVHGNWKHVNVYFSRRHLCLFKWADKIRKREKLSSRGQRWEKERTAWKGGKQFHANKGWTIGELSVSSPPSVALPLSSSQSQGRAFRQG